MHTSSLALGLLCTFQIIKWKLALIKFWIPLQMSLPLFYLKIWTVNHFHLNILLDLDPYQFQYPFVWSLRNKNLSKTLHMLLTILLNYFEYLKFQNKNKISKSIEMKIISDLAFISLWMISCCSSMRHLSSSHTAHKH